MLKSLNSSLKWIQIIIKDSEFLPGKNISNIIQLITKINSFEYVVLDYLSGASDNGVIGLLKEQERKILKLDEVLPLISKVIQFDWCDFFLFKNFPKTWDSRPKELYPYVIVQTDTTVRAVDDQYIYIYTQITEIFDLVKKQYEIESVLIDYLENLDFPE